MNTEICVDASGGKDCLEFTSIGSGPGKRWNFIKVQSYRKSKNQLKLHSQPDSGVMNQGLFYVNQSAYGILV